mmetsp:Transcript_30306/g.54879  ORF Transcript_30306/g.54879 Transcript_30306/m.54879 type:complete len:294 (-) Transcript_30306:76-957(-)
MKSMATFLLCIVLMAISARVQSFTSGPPLRCRCQVSHSHSRGMPQLFDTTTDTIDVLTTENRVSVSKPVIHWTVPGFKVGWQDDEGNWFDEDGPRNGPPMNYWRQRSDEREYNGCMDVVDAVLAEYDIESKVASLEKKSSVRKPSLTRKLLGQWAPLLLSGKRMSYNNKPSDDGGEVEVPFMVDIFRSNGRRFAPKNHYGVFDLLLENGEELTVLTTGGDHDSIHTQIIADEANEPVEIGSVGQEQLQFGGITYVSDYVMIQRSPDGAIDFFLRADLSYLGATKEEKETYHLV